MRLEPVDGVMVNGWPHDYHECCVYGQQRSEELA